MTTEELKNIAPKLYELQELKSGYTTPKNYFETVEDAIFSILITSELTNKTAFKTPENYFSTIETRVFKSIKSEEKESVFEIPKEYFDTFEDRVFEKLQSKTKVIDFKTQFSKTIVPVLAAASLLLFITLQIFNGTKNTTEDLFAKIEISEMENWIENGELVLNSYEITSIYEDLTIENINTNSLYDDDDMLNYLNEIDVESLILIN